MSKQIGWWHWVIEDWESGERAVCGDGLRMLATFFYVSTEYLFSVNNEETIKAVLNY